MESPFALPFRMDEVPFYDGVRLVLPDIVMLLVSVLVVIVPTVLRRSRPETSAQPGTSRCTGQHQDVVSALNYVGEFFLGLFLAASGIMVPSVSSRCSMPVEYACLRFIKMFYDIVRVFLYICVLYVLRWQICPHGVFLPFCLVVVAVATFQSTFINLICMTCGMVVRLRSDQRCHLTAQSIILPLLTYE